MSWVRRVETVLDILKGSSIGELELAEEEIEIIIRRNPGTMVALKDHYHNSIHHTNGQVADSRNINQYHEMKAPLTGIYYAAPSSTTAPFITVGSTVKIGQTVALIEAMKVFNEIQAEVTGHIVEIKAKDGNLVKQGDVLMQIKPL